MIIVEEQNAEAAAIQRKEEEEFNEGPHDIAIRTSQSKASDMKKSKHKSIIALTIDGKTAQNSIVQTPKLDNPVWFNRKNMTFSELMGLSDGQAVNVMSAITPNASPFCQKART